MNIETSAKIAALACKSGTLTALPDRTHVDAVGDGVSVRVESHDVLGGAWIARADLATVAKVARQIAQPQRWAVDDALRLVVTGPGKQRVAIAPARAYGLAPYAFSDAADTVDALELAAALSAVAHTMSDDPDRASIAGVRIVDGHAEAANGHCLARTPVAAAVDVVIPASAVRVIVEAVAKSGAETATVWPCGLRVGPVTVVWPQSGATWVNTAPIRAKVPDTVATVERDALEHAVAWCKRCNGDQIHVDAREGWITLSAESPEWGMVGVKVAAAIEGAAVAMRVNPSYLADAVRAATGDAVDLMLGRDRAWVVSRGGLVTIVMGISG